MNESLPPTNLVANPATSPPETPPAAKEVYLAPNRLKEMAVSERPQERLEKLGAAALSDAELLAMLLRSGTQGQDVLTLSIRMIAEAGSLAGMIGWKETDFQKLKGIGRIKALQLLTVMEIARRVVGQQTGEAPHLGRADLVAAYFQPIATGLQVEKFWVVCLNRKNRLIKRVEITSGTASNSLVHPREVFRDAIKEGALAIVCVHNHPSGDPTPSSQDIRLTRDLVEAGRHMKVTVHDHLIVGAEGRTSMRAMGLI